MRTVRVRGRGGDLHEIARAGPLRQGALVLSVAVLGVPAALMTLLALVAVLPVVALAVPPAVMAGIGFALWSMWHRQRRSGAVARVVPLHRGR